MLYRGSILCGQSLSAKPCSCLGKMEFARVPDYVYCMHDETSTPAASIFLRCQPWFGLIPCGLVT
jgi:hypothetical protein